MKEGDTNLGMAAGRRTDRSESIADKFARSITELGEEKLEKVKVLIEMELMERDRHREIKPEQFPNQ